MNKLTKSEEEIMQLIWKKGHCTVSDLIAMMETPKPPHSTISSIVRILEKKGFVDHKAYGRTYEYFAKIDKKDYSRFSLKRFVSNYFEGSMNDMVSFLVEENDLNVKELGEILIKMNSESKNIKK